MKIFDNITDIVRDDLKETIQRGSFNIPMPGYKQLETTLIYAHADTEAKRKAITEAMASDPFLEAEPVNYTVSDEEILKRLYGL